MSDFTCPVVKIGNIEKHFNADTLSITEVEGCPCIFRTGDFQPGDQAVYIPVEALIPEGREWVKQHCSHLTFKNGVHRVKAVRLRKVFSMGILVPFDAVGPELTRWVFENGKVGFAGLGTDVSEYLGITKYEEPDGDEPAPKVPLTRWQRLVRWVGRKLGIRKYRPKPERFVPTYDVQHWRKYKTAFKDGEDVIVSEKIHGTNASYVYKDGQLHVSSHKRYRPVEDNSSYWKVAKALDLETKLKDYPGLIFYGEIYGPGIQDMTYDVPQGEYRCRFFDVRSFSSMEFMDYQEAFDLVARLNLQWVPIVYHGPYDAARVEAMADGGSLIASHFREGIVVRSATERAAHCGRVSLKIVGQTYLLRKEGSEKH